jgi:hypothetical protein
MQTIAVIRKAGGKNDWSVDRPDDFERRDGVRIARQPIATVRSMFGSQEPFAREPLQDLREQR